MAELLVEADNTLVLLMDLHWVVVPTGLRYYYISPEDADAYFETVMNAEAWECLERTEKQKALSAATKLIDRLQFCGEKPEDQEYEFPREDEGEEIPADIQYACAEIALSLLEGVNVKTEIDNLNVANHSFGAVRTSRNSHIFVPEHLRAGIPSAAAWNYLKPYLKNTKTLTLYKV